MLERVKEQIPDIAKDVRINLGKVLDLDQNDGLNREQIVGSALTVAYVLNNEDLIEQLKEHVESEEVINAVKLAVSLMSLTNIYYRFVHLSEDSELSHVPAGLRMQGMMNPGVERVTFESFCLAVSAINGCGMCISSM
ncbi:MAG: alkyl hydroperoxide reductase [Legionella sp.]|nr:alkyl hydroperoxide reductase [Legionella sp.]